MNSNTRTVSPSAVLDSKAPRAGAPRTRIGARRRATFQCVLQVALLGASASCSLDKTDIPKAPQLHGAPSAGSNPSDGGASARDSQADDDGGSGACPAGTSEYFMDEVPDMTAPDMPSGGVASSSAYDSDYPAWHAFDGYGTSLWISYPFDSPAWLSYHWSDAPRVISRYALVFANGKLGSRGPRDWTLEARSDGDWVVVDERKGESHWGWLDRREYTIAVPAAYQEYRLYVTDDNDDRDGVVALSLGSLELMSRHCR
jgi:hypothetical protein